MRKWTAQLKKWFADVSNIPEDMVMDLPRITLIGRSHLSIENHKGVLAFSSNELRLAMDRGELVITGQSFVLENILDKELFLTGQIETVRFLDDKKGDGV
ncbi:sporulation protein YqfC [Sporolactobacillus sp. THM7-7]|nr:sporulation protein YqfC [Sporolactobacillus sp. THM7-7]